MVHVYNKDILLWKNNRTTGGFIYSFINFSHVYTCVCVYIYIYKSINDNMIIYSFKMDVSIQLLRYEDHPLQRIESPGKKND